MSKLGDRLSDMYAARILLGGEREAWAYVAEYFANEVRHDAIPWAHKALDDVGAPKGPDIAGRIRELVNVSSRRSLELHAHAEELARQRDQAVKEVVDAHFELNTAGVDGRTNAEVWERIRMLAASRDNFADTAPTPRLTENALAACKAFNAPTDPSDAVVYLATLLDERDAVREELRAIIVEAIKGASK